MTTCSKCNNEAKYFKQADNVWLAYCNDHCCDKKNLIKKEPVVKYKFNNLTLKDIELLRELNDL